MGGDNVQLGTLQASANATAMMQINQNNSGGQGSKVASTIEAWGSKIGDAIINLGKNAENTVNSYAYNNNSGSNSSTAIGDILSGKHATITHDTCATRT